jgi:aspartate/methionine/tyrosine aminotransferase
VATPSNPTGTLIEPDELSAMAQFAAARGGAVIVDEIYHGLVYDGAAQTALALRDDVFVINSFSKYFNMTGWRLGWLVAPERYVEAIDRIAQNVFLAASTPAQYAALAAFEPETLALLDARRDEFRARRDFLLPALRGLGFGVPQHPQGAFYIYANSAALAPQFCVCARTAGAGGRSHHPGNRFRCACRAGASAFCLYPSGRRVARRCGADRPFSRQGSLTGIIRRAALCHCHVPGFLSGFDLRQMILPAAP